MKHLQKCLLSAAALFAAASQFSVMSAAALPPPFDDYGVDLTLEGGVNESYNSNVLSAHGSPNKFDDYISTFTPGLELEWGKNAVTDVTFDYTESIYRYAKHASLNEDLSNVGLDIVRKQGAFTLTGMFGFVQNYSNSPSGASGNLAGIIRSDVLSASGNVHYDMSDKFNMDLGFGWARTSYLYSIGEAYQNSDAYTLPVDAYYVYSPELSFGLGYTYQQTDQKNSINPFTVGRERDSDTFSFNTVLTKWNKLTGTASAGFTINNIASASAEGGNPAVPSLTTTTGSYGLGLQYNYSEKVAFTLNGNRNFTVGVSGQNVENTGAGLGLIYNFTDSITVQANLITLNYSQYLQQTPARDDLAKSTGVNISWKPLDYLTLSAGYNYFMNSSLGSSNPTATYNINVVSISGSIHY
jgi:polysaccharide biosynthesis protein VpsM